MIQLLACQGSGSLFKTRETTDGTDELDESKQKIHDWGLGLAHKLVRRISFKAQTSFVFVE